MRHGERYMAAYSQVTLPVCCTDTSVDMIESLMFGSALNTNIFGYCFTVIGLSYIQQTSSA